MNRNTPEVTLEGAFDRACILAKQHGFEPVFGVRRLHPNGYVTSRSSQRGEMSLTEEDFGPKTPRLEMSLDKWLELKDGPETILVDKIGTFSNDRNDYVALVLGRLYLKQLQDRPIFRMGFSPSRQKLEGGVSTLSSLPQVLSKNDQNIELGLTTEFCYVDDPIGFYVNAAAALAIPGIRGGVSTEWFRDRGGNGQQVIRSILDDSFQMLERYHRLIALGNH